MRPIDARRLIAENQPRYTLGYWALMRACRDVLALEEELIAICGKLQAGGGKGFSLQQIEILYKPQLLSTIERLDVVDAHDAKAAQDALWITGLAA